ncbi:hypothetical protein [Microbacterium paraoxydans]|uniref:hypothetical protein n=1 Tax=Microbacterium paraoxydans TaxID=199592 RepID=UPI00201240BC|nr:hypothetical protein [Microbacterium paraoxydans]
MHRSVTRSIGFWILLIVSLAAIGVGGWLIAGQIGTMTSTLLDGTATGVEVYVGQSLVVVGAAVLGAGLIGLLLALALVAARALVPSPALAPVALEPAVDEPVEDRTRVQADPATPQSDVMAPTEDGVIRADESAASAAVSDAASDEQSDQNGSSGSTATATKISVK